VEEYCKSMPSTVGCTTVTIAPATTRPRMCCLAMSAKCLACKAGQSIDQYCKEKPDTDGCPSVPPKCCKAMTATCQACAKGQTVEEYCKNMPFTAGCLPETTTQPKQQQGCCMAITATCLACKEGVTVDEYCKKMPEAVGCPKMQKREGEPCGWCWKGVWSANSCGECDDSLECQWAGFLFWRKTGAFRKCKATSTKAGLKR
jgi:hypothetical protein